MEKKIIILLVILGLTGLIASNSLFFVDEREQALVFQFGQFKQAHREPGLKVKVPFIQDVLYYPKQALSIDPRQPEFVTLFDQKRLMVDAFAYVRIADPLLFYQTLRTEENARINIGGRLNSALREALGRYTVDSLLSSERVEIMQEITRNLSQATGQQGIQLLDVRIRRAEFSPEIREAMYARMRSEREREAQEARAEGEREATQIRSRAERERDVLIAEARRDAQKIRGEGDSKAIAIYAESLNADPQFYSFYRSLEAYRNTLATEDTTLVLSPTGEFFKHFKPD